MDYDEKPVRDYFEAFLRGDERYPGTDLNLLLTDPCSFKKGMIDVELVRITATIEHMEKIIAEAHQKIEKLRPELAKVQKRCERYELDYAKLKPGQKIPKHLLPDEKDIRSRVADYIKICKDCEAENIAIPKSIEGWAVIKATVKQDRFKFSMVRRGVISLEKLDIPEIENWEFDNAEIDSFGGLSVEMRVLYDRPDLKIDAVTESALRSIDEYAEKFAAGTIVQKSSDAVVGFHRNQYAKKPPFAQALERFEHENTAKWRAKTAKTLAKVQMKWVEPGELLDSS